MISALFDESRLGRLLLSHHSADRHKRTGDMHTGLMAWRVGHDPTSLMSVHLWRIGAAASW
jgi:hypothetical protein